MCNYYIQFLFTRIIICMRKSNFLSAGSSIISHLRVANCLARVVASAPLFALGVYNFAVHWPRFCIFHARGVARTTSPVECALYTWNVHALCKMQDKDDKAFWESSARLVLSPRLFLRSPPCSVSSLLKFSSLTRTFPWPPISRPSPRAWHCTFFYHPHWGNGKWTPQKLLSSATGTSEPPALARRCQKGRKKNKKCSCATRDEASYSRKGVGSFFPRSCEELNSTGIRREIYGCAPTWRRSISGFSRDLPPPWFCVRVVTREWSPFKRVGTRNARPSEISVTRRNLYGHAGIRGDRL